MPRVPRNAWNAGVRLGSAAAPAPDGALVVIHPRARHPARGRPGRRGGRAAGRGSRATGSSGPRSSASSPRPHDHRRPGDPAEAERDVHRREPQVPLGELARAIRRAARRVGRQVHRPQLRAPGRGGWSCRAPSRSARRSPSPASVGCAASSAGCRARPRRPPSPPAPARTAAACRAHGVAHRVAGEPQTPGDRLDRDLPRPGAAGGSRPSPPRSATPSSQARRPSGSLGSFDRVRQSGAGGSVFDRRQGVSIGPAPTIRALVVLQWNPLEVSWNGRRRRVSLRRWSRPSLRWLAGRVLGRRSTDGFGMNFS